MATQDKLLDKLRNANKMFSWNDLVTLLNHMGYEKQEMAGSRVRFYNQKTGHMIRLHRPHPENAIRGGALRDIKNALKTEGYL